VIQSFVSGRQTGVDIAALDWAIERGIPHGGWCPRRRLAENGTIDERYHLKETSCDRYIQRTDWNDRERDGTVVTSIAAELTGGSKKKVELARRHGKPLIHIFRDGGTAAPTQVLARFIEDHKVQVLNVAGPRASKEPEVYEFVERVLANTFCQGGPRSSATAHKRPPLDSPSSRSG